MRWSCPSSSSLEYFEMAQNLSFTKVIVPRGSVIATMACSSSAAFISGGSIHAQRDSSVGDESEPPGFVSSTFTMTPSSDAWRPYTGSGAPATGKTQGYAVRLTPGSGGKLGFGGVERREFVQERVVALEESREITAQIGDCCLRALSRSIASLSATVCAAVPAGFITSSRCWRRSAISASVFAISSASAFRCAGSEVARVGT